MLTYCNSALILHLLYVVNITLMEASFLHLHYIQHCTLVYTYFAVFTNLSSKKRVRLQRV